MPPLRPAALARIRAIPLAFLAGFFAMGCGPGDAPKDLNDLSRTTFRVWPDADPKAMVEALATLEMRLMNYPLTGDIGDRSFENAPLRKEDLTAITWPMERN